jgi:hypothetical protein
MVRRRSTHLPPPPPVRVEPLSLPIGTPVLAGAGSPLALAGRAYVFATNRTAASDRAAPRVAVGDRSRPGHWDRGSCRAG